MENTKSNISELSEKFGKQKVTKNKAEDVVFRLHTTYRKTEFNENDGRVMYEMKAKISEMLKKHYGYTKLTNNVFMFLLFRYVSEQLEK